MPINLIHSKLHRVERGWDPISREYSKQYDDLVSNSECAALVHRLDVLSGGLEGKTVLDLGAGPGHFSILFAQRGAKVVWHDVSREYQSIARKRAADQRVTLQFSLGYLEEARRFGKECFDLVFCRVCWYYCRSDRAFARLIYSLVKPGGVGYVECNTPMFAKLKGLRKLQSWLNEWTWWKIGHPMPPHGRIAKLIQKYPLESLELDYSSEFFDVVFFVKGGKQAELCRQRNLSRQRPGYESAAALRFEGAK